MRTVLLVLVLVLALSSAALAWSHWWTENSNGYLENWGCSYELNGRLLIQLRPIFEGIGWDVAWDPDTDRIDATHGNDRVTMHVGDPVAMVNGQAQIMHTYPRRIYGLVYVPLRFIAEVSGATVDYQAGKVTITSPDGLPLLVHANNCR